MSPKLSRKKTLTLVGASAGSGKTHRLSQEVLEALGPNSESAIAPEELVAVTYTRKAAVELGARIRRTLIESGAYERAQTLPLAYLGTVHAVCLRLVQEFALDAGLSPRVDILAMDEAKLLREALEAGLPSTLRVRLQTLATAWQFRWDPKVRRTDWLTPVEEIMSLARSNRIAPSALPAMAERSVAGLLALLGRPEKDGDALDRALAAALEDAKRALDRVEDGQANTAKARDQINEALRDSKKGRLPWHDWVGLLRVTPGKKALDAVALLHAVAARVERHPRLHAEIREFTTLLFDAARVGLEAYDAWKKRRRVVDFVDMIDRALTLTGEPAVAGELRTRLKLLVVDEFQDTSPVQLALFARLHSLAGRSTWVGDRKQCIFEFAGSDPALMEAVTAWAAGGGTVQQLEHNWRSRPALVTACTHLFSGAFARHGFDAREVTVSPKREEPPELASLPPFGVWSIAASNKAQEATAVAEGVRRFLSDPAASPVVDRTTGRVRSARPGDIAILVASNLEADAISDALATLGIRTNVARVGLLGTPEGTMLSAALRVLLDPRDALSRAVLDALTGFGGQASEAWLEERIAKTEADKVAKEAGKPRAAAGESEIVARARALARDVETLGPAEAVDRVIGMLDLPAFVSRWPDPRQRVANLDALRALTATYEEGCAAQREAATLAGLLRFFEETADERLAGDEMRAVDAQHVTAGDHAVSVLTYHKAKGLEWPVVVLGSLDRPERRDAFDVCPETDKPEFDPADPLSGRWIRFWAWPFGLHEKVPLAEAAARSREGTAVALREERERVRLLYVGFTRARDHLVLVARYNAKRKVHATAWLDELADADAKPLVRLPSPDEAKSPVELRGRKDKTLRAAVRHWMLDGAAEPTTVVAQDEHRVFERPAAPRTERSSYWIAPSRAVEEWPEVARVARVAGDAEPIGEPLPLGPSGGVAWDVVGTAVHGFLAADLPGLSREQRLVRAERLLDAADLRELLKPESLLRAGDQLRAWAETRWPRAVWRREVAVTGVVTTEDGAKRVSGTIDLLLETSDGVVLVDHKSFPGGQSALAAKALSFAPQLGAYTRVLEAAGKRVLGQWVHFPLGARVVAVRSATESV
ncbi:MAG: UvrD-helicase domain-containing protein [Polyangiaceae bacterium]